MDLSTFTDTTTLEAPIASLWRGAIGTFRIDVNESNAPRAFRLSNVKLTADDAPNGSGFFPVRWRIDDATYTAGVVNSGGADATVALYYDTDLNPASKTLIASGLNGASGLYYWNMAGLAPGVYYVYAVVTDASGSSQGRYSTGPVRVSAAIPAATDSNGNGLADAWEAKYRRVRTRAGTTTAMASPTWPSTAPGRIRACRTAGRWRRAQPASSPSGWRSPTPTRRRPTSRSRSCGRRPTRRSRGPIRCCHTAARRSTSTRWPAWARPTCRR